MEEIWKDIMGYEGLYQVSNLGRVRSLDRYINVRGNINHRKGLMLKPVTNVYGYHQYILSKNGYQKLFRAHRLILLHFSENTHKKPSVNHKNGIKTDNRVENLEWCTAKENNAHAIKTGLNNMSGENNHNSKLTYQQIIEIKSIKGRCSDKIGEKYGVSGSLIRKIRRNEIWKST